MRPPATPPADLPSPAPATSAPPAPAAALASPAALASTETADVAAAEPAPVPAADSTSAPSADASSGGALSGGVAISVKGPQGKRTPGGPGRSAQELNLPPLPPKPNRRERLSADLEAEIEAALGGRTLDAMLTGTEAAASKELVELDSRRAATVVRVHGDNAFFSLGGRHEGVASVRQFATPPEAGQAYDVIVRGYNNEDGLYELLIPGASIEVGDWSDLQEGSIVEARVTGANTGGLEVEVNKMRGFIPISQIALYRIENTAEFVGQKLVCVVTEANPQRRNLVLSRRAVLEREKEESRRKFYEQLQVGQVLEGVVRKIEDFGAFVDLGGADGLIHVSQMSWDRVKHPSEAVELGQKVKVRVEKFDPQTGKIGLSLRTLQENPWDNIDTKFPVGSTAKGTVSRIAKFGAFVKLASGVEGLIHISELAHYRVTQVEKVVKEGQEVEVKVVSIDPENQRIGLSLKATLAKPEPVDASKSAIEEKEEPPRQPAIKRKPGPLKGGFDRPTGGDGIGLNW